MHSQPNRFSFELQPQFDLSLRRMGPEREPLLIIERVLRDPGALVEYAATQVDFKPAWKERGGYPGIRAPAPLNYVERLVKAIGPSIERAFGLTGVRLARAECSLSMVTLTPGELRPFQTIPHVDTVDPLQFAVLHYLCPREMGGTAFYRHRATGFQSLTAERSDEYDRIRDEELAEASLPSGYITSSSDHYEQVDAVEAAYDRVTVYRSRTFHSGQIPAGIELSNDPRYGRLTANIFVNYAHPKKAPPGGGAVGGED